MTEKTISEQLEHINKSVDEIKNTVESLTNLVNGLVENQKFTEEVNQTRFAQLIKRVEDKADEIKSKINQL